MPAFELTLARPFVADHFHDLPGFQEDRHGHNWTVEATVAPGPDDPEGLAAAGALDAWVGGVDYTLLNARPSLAGRNPTAELLAQDCLEALEAAGQAALRVRIREKANYWAACARASA